MRYGFIYETLNTVNGRKYVGKHKRSQNPRDPDDSWYLGSSTNPDFEKDIQKYGIEKFTRRIIVEADSEEELCRLEEEYLESVDAQYNYEYYNLMNRSGGGALTGDSLEKMRKSLTGKSIPLEVRRKMSLTHSSPRVVELKRKALIGRKVSEETKRKISASLKGRCTYTRSVEQCQAISQRNKERGYWSGDSNPKHINPPVGELNSFYGKHHTEEARKKISDARENYVGENHPLYGKHHNEETKRKISESLSGREVSEETRIKLREAAKNKVYRKVCSICGLEFNARSSRSKYCDDCKIKRDSRT